MTDELKPSMTDHERGCEGREYTCTCGFDAERDAAIAALMAENERLRDAEQFTLSDASRLLRKVDVEGICQSIEACFDSSDRVRCGPCAVAASKAKGIVVDDTHSHLPEVCRLRREVKSAEARATAAEARLAEAVKVLEPFAAVAEHDIGEDEFDDDVFRPISAKNAHAQLINVGNLRAARAFIEKEKSNG